MNPIWQSLLTAVDLISVQSLDIDPNLYLCPLTEQGLISLDGEQSQSFLQGQLTCDIHQLQAINYLNGAQCDAKGKMWAIIKIFSFDNQCWLSGHQQEIAASLVQLKKYGVFAKTTISDQSEAYLTFGLGGSDAAAWLASHYAIDLSAQQTAWDIAQGKVLKLSADRFLLVLKATEGAILLAQHQTHVYHPDLWSSKNILSGIAHLSEPTINQFVPQMLNLQCLDAICFTKGCYSGQEMVARMKYLGKNKRAAFILRGTASTKPVAGQAIQVAIGDNWRSSGTVINVTSIAVNENPVQCIAIAILPNDTAVDAKLRIMDDEASSLTITPLPYSVDQ